MPFGRYPTCNTQLSYITMFKKNYIAWVELETANTNFTNNVDLQFYLILYYYEN